MSSPAVPMRGCTWPLAVHTFPTHWLLLRPKFCLTELAATITICSAAKTLSSEDFCLAILAVGTAHGHKPPSLLNDCIRKDNFSSESWGAIQKSIFFTNASN